MLARCASACAKGGKGSQVMILCCFITISCSFHIIETSDPSLMQKNYLFVHNLNPTHGIHTRHKITALLHSGTLCRWSNWPSEQLLSESNTMWKASESHITECITSKEQTMAHPHAWLRISFFQRAVRLEFDPEPAIKKSLNTAAFFWSCDDATILCHGCC